MMSEVLRMKSDDGIQRLFVCLRTMSDIRALKRPITVAAVELSYDGISRKLIFFFGLVCSIFPALISCIKFKQKDQQMRFGFMNVIFII